MTRRPLIVVHRRWWREIAATAAGASRELGGVIVGRRARRGAIHFWYQIPVAHCESTIWQAIYDDDELAAARKASHDEYGPQLEPMGGWHLHVYPRGVSDTESTEISDADLPWLQEGDVEAIVSVQPRALKLDLLDDENTMRRVVGDRYVRMRVWKKHGRVASVCRLSLR